MGTPGDRVCWQLGGVEGSKKSQPLWGGRVHPGCLQHPGHTWQVPKADVVVQFFCPDSGFLWALGTREVTLWEIWWESAPNKDSMF